MTEFFVFILVRGEKTLLVKIAELIISHIFSGLDLFFEINSVGYNTFFFDKFFTRASLLAYVHTHRDKKIMHFQIQKKKCINEKRKTISHTLVISIQ